MTTKDLSKLEDMLAVFAVEVSVNDDILINGELSRHMAKAAEVVFDAYIISQLYYQKESM